MADPVQSIVETIERAASAGGLSRVIDAIGERNLYTLVLGAILDRFAEGVQFWTPEARAAAIALYRCDEDDEHDNGDAPKFLLRACAGRALVQGVLVGRGFTARAFTDMVPFGANVNVQEVALKLHAEIDDRPAPAFVRQAAVDLAKTYVIASQASGGELFWQPSYLENQRQRQRIGRRDVAKEQRERESRVLSDIRHQERQIETTAEHLEVALRRFQQKLGYRQPYPDELREFQRQHETQIRDLRGYPRALSWVREHARKQGVAVAGGVDVEERIQLLEAQIDKLLAQIDANRAAKTDPIPAHGFEVGDVVILPARKTVFAYYSPSYGVVGDVGLVDGRWKGIEVNGFRVDPSDMSGVTLVARVGLTSRGFENLKRHPKFSSIKRATSITREGDSVVWQSQGQDGNERRFVIGPDDKVKTSIVKG